MRTVKDTKYGYSANKRYDSSVRLDNANLDSLEGSPSEVMGDFEVAYNRLTTLTHAPKEIKGDFCCNDNILTSLEGAPEFVAGNFNCFGNQLTSLKGMKPTSANSKLDWNVFGTFNCSENPHLKNPKEQIIKYQIKADDYITDEGRFKFTEIEDEYIDFEMKQKVSSKGFRTLLGLK